MFEWTEEQNLLGTTLSAFGRAELAPQAESHDENETFNEPAFRKLGALGFLGITVPGAYGGSEQGCLEATLAMERLSEHCASTTLSYLAHSILCVNNLNENASLEQKKKYLPKLVSGEWIGGMGMTEPEAGSDMMGMQTRADKQGDHYVLKGSKTFITNGPCGDVFIVYARTGTDKTNISTFIVEKTFPGFSVGTKLKKFGMRASPTSELVFENCKVPIANRIGEENESITHLMKNLNMERITISGISIGIATAALEYSIGYVKERKQFGQPLAQFQMTQQKLADMATQLDAGKAITYMAARAYDRGERTMSLGAKAKLFTAVMGTNIAMESIQLLGGYGYSKEYPVERYLRDAKLMEIGAGTNEIMRIIVARDLLES